MIPVHDIDFGIQYVRNRDTVSMNAHYEGLRYERTANVDYIPAYFVLSAFYKRRLGEVFSLSVAADNVFSESYQIVEGYPMPGLFIRTGIEAIF
jgi:outer membrane receptor protein involved in Fe transport